MGECGDVDTAAGPQLMGADAAAVAVGATVGLFDYVIDHVAEWQRVRGQLGIWR